MDHHSTTTTAGIYEKVRNEKSMSQDQFLNIDTPENVVFGYEIADIGSRFLAALVDSTLIVLALFVAYFTGFLFISSLGLGPDTMAPGIIIALIGFFSFLVIWGYYILFEMIWNGQSPGKRWQRLRVLRSDGTPIGTSESVIRNLVRIIDFLPLFYGIGLITMFVNKKARRLGDFAAGTLVVHEESSVTLDDLKITSDKQWVARAEIRVELGSKLNFPVEQLSAQDIQLAEDFLKRRYELRNRDYLAKQIARSLCAKMAIPPDSTEGMSAEDILIQVVLTYRKQFEVAAE